MVFRGVMLAFLVVGMATVGLPAMADDGCAPPPCGPAVAPCQPAALPYVEKTILCPTWVREKRLVTVTECRPETRERTDTVCRLVPETRQVERQCTVMVPQVQKRVEPYTVCKPVWREERREYTVMVPHTEMRQGTRRVCRMVAVQQTRTVCEDQGHWEERPVTPCGQPCPPTCAPAACEPAKQAATCRVWVPKIVQKQIPVTCMKPQWVDEPCTYPVTVCKPEKRVCTVRVCHYEKVTAQREVCYTVCVPKVVRRVENVTTYKTITEPKTCKYTVMVPRQVQKEAEVLVCKLVEKKIQVPLCTPTCAQPACCARPCRRGC
jgi:hypothetical protein